MYLDSPFTFCERVGVFVLLDQTYEDCRHDVRCAQCPWREFFTGQMARAVFVTGLPFPNIKDDRVRCDLVTYVTTDDK